MNVPLSISTFFNNKGSEHQKLKIWTNGEKKIVTAPILPYLYTKERPIYPCITDRVKRRLLSNPYKEVDLYKCSFNSSGDVGRFGNDKCYENHIQFPHRVMMDEPKWVTRFLNNKPLKIICFDCEMRTDGRTFPIAARNSIAGIGWKCITGTENLASGEGINSPDIITTWSDNNSDHEPILEFLEVVEKFDPDILVGFNSNGFDLRYVRDRCAINGINFNRYIARSMESAKPVEFISRKNVASRKTYTEVRIDGRISYDLYYPVIRDQSMFGIKSRQMKDVAAWYKIKDIVKEDMSNVNKYLDNEDGRKTIDRYLRSDVNITEQLFKIYLGNTTMLSEKLYIPLDEMVNATPSLMSNLIFGRELMAKNIVSDGSVAQRYPKKHVEKKRGGWVETYKSGYVKKIKKLDFKSYYPFTVVQFNISSETCFIVAYEEFKGELGYKFWREQEIINGENIEWFFASIPDSTLGKNVVVKIDQTHQGFLPRYMRELFDERAMLKKRMKEIVKEIGIENAGDNVEHAGLKSRENAVKIIINSFTGYVGNQYALYGNLACYAAITGMGRYFTQRIIEKYLDLVISSDTDAIYEDVSGGGISEEEANKYIESMVIGELGFKKCWIVMEEEGNFGAAYFMKTTGKNYYILNLDRNTVIKHGVATKRSSMAKIIDKSTDEIVSALLLGGFSNKNEELLKAIDKAYDISKWTVKDIQQGVHVRKLSDYKKGTPLGLTVARLAQERWKIPESNLDGMQFSYIKLKGESNYAVVSDADNLNDFPWDRDYYLEMLDRTLKGLGLQDFKPDIRASVDTKQKSIDEAWG